MLVSSQWSCIRYIPLDGDNGARPNTLERLLETLSSTVGFVMSRDSPGVTEAVTEESQVWADIFSLWPLQPAPGKTKRKWIQIVDM